MNQLTTTGGALAFANAADALLPTNIGDAMRLAEMMSKSKLVPEHLRTPGDCFMVIETAMRWRMSPFAVAQGMFNLKGKNGFAGALIHAAIEQTAPIQGHISYHFDGEGPSRRVTVRGVLLGETEPREVAVSLKDAATANEHWKKSPDQMLCYHAARVWARRHTPSVIFGAYSREELMDSMGDTPAAPLPAARGPSIDAVPADLRPVPAASYTMLRPDGAEWVAPSMEKWTAACQRVIAKLSAEGAGALVAWRDAMGPHFDAMGPDGAGAVSEVWSDLDEAIDGAAAKAAAAVDDDGFPTPEALAQGEAA